MLKEDYPEKSAALESVSAAVQNMLLMAFDKGIGSCWKTAPIGAGMDDELRRKFAPDRGEFVAAVTMGYHVSVPKAPKRKEGRYKII